MDNDDPLNLADRNLAPDSPEMVLIHEFLALAEKHLDGMEAVQQCETSGVYPRASVQSVYDTLKARKYFNKLAALESRFEKLNLLPQWEALKTQYNRIVTRKRRSPSPLAFSVDYESFESSKGPRDTDEDFTLHP